VVRDATLHVALPTAALTAANIVLGRALARSERLRERETAAIRALQAQRTPARDRLAWLVSTASDVPESVLHGLVAVAVLGRRTGRWRVAAVPALALVLETVTYLAAGRLVNRERPDVPRLDHEQPTSSFPSGHEGATVALMVVYALLARGVRSPLLRVAIGTGCLAYPATLAWARVHTGMHYPSDVVAGAANGLASGLLAWHYLRGWNHLREAAWSGPLVSAAGSSAGSAGSNSAVTRRVGNTRRP
jgi:undecaprenyl-diphosphatase